MYRVIVRNEPGNSLDFDTYAESVDYAKRFLATYGADDIKPHTIIWDSERREELPICWHAVERARGRAERASMHYWNHAGRDYHIA